MEFISIPGLIFLGIQIVAYSVGETQLGTLASGGVFMCCGIYYGWRMWGRSNERKDDDVR